MRRIFCSRISVCCLVLFLIQPGCATNRKAPTPEERATFGTIGVARASYLPETEFDIPAKGRPEGAAKGAAIAFFGVIEGGMQGGGSVGEGAALYLLALLALATAATPVGAAVGAVKAMPGDEAAASDKVAREILERLRTQEVLREEVIREGTGKTRFRFVPVDKVGPTSIDKETTYEALAGEGIDTILELALRRIALETDNWGSDPPLALSMKSRCRLIRVREGTVIDDREYRALSPRRKLSEWAADNAALLGKAYERAYRKLAEDIISRLFISTPPPGSDNAAISPDAAR